LKEKKQQKGKKIKICNPQKQRRIISFKISFYYFYLFITVVLNNN